MATTTKKRSQQHGNHVRHGFWSRLIADEVRRTNVTLTYCSVADVIFCFVAKMSHAINHFCNMKFQWHRVCDFDANPNSDPNANSNWNPWTKWFSPKCIWNDEFTTSDDNRTFHLLPWLAHKSYAQLMIVVWIKKSWSSAVRWMADMRKFSMKFMP